MINAINVFIKCEQCHHLCDVDIRIVTNVPINNQLVGEYVCPECGADNKIHLTVIISYKKLYDEQNGLSYP